MAAQLPTAAAAAAAAPNSSQPPTHIHPQSIDTMSTRSDITSVSASTTPRLVHRGGSHNCDAPSRRPGMMTVTPQGVGAQPTRDQSRQSSTITNQPIEGSTSSLADQSIDGPAANATLQTAVGSHLNSSSMTNTLDGEHRFIFRSESLELFFNDEYPYGEHRFIFRSVK